MKTNHLLAASALLLAGSAMLATAGEKKALGHDDFDAWKSVRNYSLSRDGVWAAYAVNPQEGDGVLTFRNNSTGRSIDVARGYQPSFTADGRWAVALVKPLFADTRQGKIDKKKDHEMPQDSMVIVDLRKMSVKRIGNVNGYKIAKEGGDWVAYKSCDTTLIKPADLKEKESRPLVVFNLSTGDYKVTNYVKDYLFSEDGSRLALTVKKPENDSISTDCVGVMDLPDTSFVVVDRDKRHYGTPSISRDGRYMAYTASDDSTESGTRRTAIFLSDLTRSMRTPTEIPLSFRDSAGRELLPNQYSKVGFSHNSRRLIAGVAPVVAPDDTTIVDFEKGKLDIWVWNAPYIPPMEENLLDQIKENNYPVAIDLQSLKPTLITDNWLAEVMVPDRWDGNHALVIDPTSAAVSYQWDYLAPTDMQIVDVNTGASKAIGKFRRGNRPELSPADKYVAWFDKRTWWVYDIATGKTIDAGKEVPAELWNTDAEYPMEPSPWEESACAWSKDDAALLVYDKYDIWSLDPKGERKPECLTAGEGRRRNIRFRYRNTDPENRLFLTKGDLMLLDVFDYENKYKGLATMTYGAAKAPAVQVLDGHSYTQVRKARNKDVFTWQRANFSETPDIWLSQGLRFANARQLTDANPQLKDYSWGTAQLVKWNAYDGKPSEGVLYLPENYDPSKKYPMLAVFYETGSEDLYTHYTMEPSWSWVNYPFYVSRGYVVFVPDIHYTSGRPGEDAYNYVCSGCEEMCRRYPFIDKDRIGIDGQSWGGYQTAFLVTRTDMFACAGSGAPVANMTSAYGGIRWESGDSRQGQYEQGQSRIGRTLWEAPEMYIQSSPVFHADRCHTPLLIMHNDNDGAVPWYQGIELFMALRRLEKPVWMLQYNGESHNIRARKNRKDITVRLQQFFDHYLKGDPMPKWMKEGVPMIRKGQEWGFKTE